MTSRIDETGHTKALGYPVAEHWGKAEMFSSAVLRTKYDKRNVPCQWPTVAKQIIIININSQVQ